jgi:hypothetical protein
MLLLYPLLAPAALPETHHKAHRRAGPTLAAHFATMNEPMVEEDFYIDEWDTWLSG